jgi:hypothetical protein
MNQRAQELQLKGSFQERVVRLDAPWSASMASGTFQPDPCAIVCGNGVRFCGAGA